MSPLANHIVGRDGELGSIERILDGLDRGHPGAIELVGEPGIGKSRLLRELAARAETRGHLVLSGAGAELERDLPFSVFVDALDQYLAGLDPNRLARLDGHAQAEIGHIFPSLWRLAALRDVAPQQERYRSHRAVRVLLEHLAQSRPLVLALDDFHWADSGSIELLGALLRRPPAAAVLITIAVRPRQVPQRLGAAVERAQRAVALTRIELGAFTLAEARELLGGSVDATEVPVLHAASGGNPFYLEQLARASERSGGFAPVSEDASSRVEVPAAVAASLSEELDLLSKDTRLMLEGAAVAGDPFESDLAAAAAGTSDDAMLDAIDELLRLDLVRPTDLPRRFQFRHPLVRRAVYEAAPASWRLRAHERCADALVARGAPAASRAHHVERSARQGDLASVAVLREAGEAASRLAPESAARWFAGALRLLPESSLVEDRVELMLVRARALAAAGHFHESHDALVEALAIVPERSSVLLTAAATACAGVERLLGRYEQAHTRLIRALQGLPEPASVEAAGLLIELTLNEFYRSRYDAMLGWADRAVTAARACGDPTLLAAAVAMPALGHAITGSTEAALAHQAEAAALVDGLSDEALSARLDAAGWLAAAELYLDLYAEADAHASRVLALGRATGRADPFFRLYQILPRVWTVRGKLDDAAELVDGAIEGVRLLGTPPALAGNLFNRSVIAIAAGDLGTAMATAEEAFQLTRGLDEGFVSAWAAMRFAAVHFETEAFATAVELLLSRAGGEELLLIPGGWRAHGLELLTRCWLALDRPAEAECAAGRAEAIAVATSLPLAGAWAGHAIAAVALHVGDTATAAVRALLSAEAADRVGAPIEAALSRTLAGRALAERGENGRAIAELERAVATLDACGALRYRQRAERALGKLGHRPYRRTTPGRTDATGIDSLTERELEVARLVVDRRTNPEIAAALFLSQKTVETHLRNIFNKVGVATRVDLARAVEHAGRAAGAGAG